MKKTDKLPATLVEFQLRDWIGKAWGDVSLEQGCSGPATISATDGTSNTNGFTYDILNDAPDAAFFKNTINSPVMTDGALDTTMGNWWGPANQAAITWEQEKVGQKKAYIVGGEGTDVVHSANGCLAVDFY